VTERGATAGPGAGRYRFAGTRAADGGYALIYAPAGRSFGVRQGAVSGERMRAWWFDPRTGQATELGERSTGEEHRFTPPRAGEELDWVLVLDDAARGFGPPGKPAGSTNSSNARSELGP
jgi:hypothetical protein